MVTRCNKAHFRMCFKASKLKESKRTKNKKKEKVAETDVEEEEKCK